MTMIGDDGFRAIRCSLDEANWNRISKGFLS